MVVGDELVEIPPVEWQNLQELFKVNWPANVVAFYTIQNYINWFKKEPNLPNIKIYSLNGDWSDGTYIIVDRYQLYVYTLEKSCLRLKRGLELLDWSKGLFVSSFMEKHRIVIEHVIQAFELEYSLFDHTHMYFYPQEEAKKIEITIPEGVTFRQLTEANAEQINEAWPFKHDGSLYFVKRAIRMNTNIGVFNNENKLIAWCLRQQSGALGLLQVSDTCYRNGLGFLVAKYVTKKLAEAGDDTFAFVVEANMPSHKMFQKCGFDYMDDSYWIFTKPVGTSGEFEWKND